MIDFTNDPEKEHEFEQASMNYLHNATMSSKLAYENDVNTIKSNLRLLDPNSLIAGKFAFATLNDLNTNYYSDRYDSAIRNVRNFID